MKLRLLLLLTTLSYCFSASSEEFSKYGDLAYEVKKGKLLNSYHLRVYAEDDSFFSSENGHSEPKLCIFSDLASQTSKRLEPRKLNSRWVCSLLVESSEPAKENLTVHVVYENSVSMAKIDNSVFNIKHNQSKK